MADVEPLDEAKTHLSEATLRVETERTTRIAPPGALHGLIAIADDYDAPLPELAAYIGERE